MAAYPDAQALNTEVHDWTHDTSNALLNEIERLDIVDTGTLFRRLRYNIKHSFGLAERIGYGFPRHGVFVEKGVGRGRPVGSVKAKRFARPWFNPTLDEALPELGSRLADQAAYLTINSIKIQ